MSVLAKMRHALIRSLDRRGGRATLGLLASRYATRVAGIPVGIAFRNGAWTHSVRGAVYADDERFNYSTSVLAAYGRHDWGSDDPEELWYYLAKPPVGGTVVDVGAGIGSDTVCFARTVGASGKVIAVEASPATFRCLVVTCTLNRLTQVTPVHAAAMDVQGVVNIEETGTSVTNRVIEQNSDCGMKTTAVRSVLLDDLIETAGLDSVDLLKMNIEGAERKALLGMSRLAARTKVMCICCHDFLEAHGGEGMRTVEFVQAWLEREGFEVRRRASDVREYVRYHVHAVRRGL